MQAYDFKNRAFPPGPPKGLDLVEKMWKEKDIKINPITERIRVLEEEFYTIIDKYNVAESTFNNTTGFWNRIKAKQIVINLHKKLMMNRELRQTLYGLRLGINS